MIVVNFSHSLTGEHLEALQQRTGHEVTRVIDRPAAFDHGAPFADQARALVDAVGLSRPEWESEALLVNLPSLSPIAALVLAELHGRMGHFPSVIRMRP